MPEKKNGIVIAAVEFIDFRKCDKYLKHYALQANVNEDDWKDESIFCYDDGCYILTKLRKRLENPDKYSKEEVNNAQYSFDIITKKVHPLTEKYEKLLKEGETLDTRSKGFKGPIL